MHPADLIGHWHSDPYDYGSMESTDLVLVAGGVGWTQVQNAAGANDVRRFTWDCPKPGVIEIRYTVSIDVSGSEQDDEFVRSQYTRLVDETAMWSESFQALQLSVMLDFARQFGLKTREADITEDPTYARVPY